MLTVLHGDNILASRKALESVKIKAKDKEIINLEGKKDIDLGILKQALEAKSLFSKEKLVVIENLITDNKKQITNNILKYIWQEKFDADLIIWERKLLTPSILTKFKKKGAKIQVFKQPVIIFKFLDSIKPANTKEMFALLTRCIKTSEAEFIFHMVVRQFRMLIAVKDNAIIDEVKRLAPWQLGRFKKQTSYFSLNKLIKLYKELLIIDYQVKTGKSAYKLTSRLELFMINI